MYLFSSHLHFIPWSFNAFNYLSVESVFWLLVCCLLASQKSSFFSEVNWICFCWAITILLKVECMLLCWFNSTRFLIFFLVLFKTYAFQPLVIIGLHPIVIQLNWFVTPIYFCLTYIQSYGSYQLSTYNLLTLVSNFFLIIPAYLQFTIILVKSNQAFNTISWSMTYSYPCLSALEIFSWPAVNIKSLSQYYWDAAKKPYLQPKAIPYLEMIPGYSPHLLVAPCIPVQLIFFPEHTTHLFQAVRSTQSFFTCSSHLILTHSWLWSMLLWSHSFLISSPYPFWCWSWQPIYSGSTHLFFSVCLFYSCLTSMSHHIPHCSLISSRSTAQMDSWLQLECIDILSWAPFCISMLCSFF